MEGVVRVDEGLFARSKLEPEVKGVGEGIERGRTINSVQMV